MVAGGYLIVTISLAITVLESYILIASIDGTHFIQIASLVSGAIFAWAWWSIVPVLQTGNLRRHLRRPLRVFACANAVLSLGYVGFIVQEFDHVGSSGLIYALSGNWGVMIVGLIVAAIGFVKISYGTNAPRNDAVTSVAQYGLIKDNVLQKTERSAFRTTRTLILMGYAILAVAMGIVGWATHYGYLHALGSYYYAAAAVSSGLIGWAWWSCIARLVVSPSSRKHLTVSLRCFASANGVMAIANVAFLPNLSPFGSWLNGFGVQISLAISAMGFALIAIGFWKASGLIGGNGMTDTQAQRDGSDEESKRLAVEC
ncbi:MAG: hypothetical protein ACYDEP_08780 [Acidimicrobiales bacterium]